MSRTSTKNEVSWPSYQATTNVPFARQFYDEQEIKSFFDIVTNLFEIYEKGKKKHLQKFHVAYDESLAIVVFYVGRRPNRAQLKAIVERDCGVQKYEWVWDCFTIPCRS